MGGTGGARLAAFARNGADRSGVAALGSAALSRPAVGLFQRSTAAGNRLRDFTAWPARMGQEPRSENIRCMVLSQFVWHGRGTGSDRIGGTGCVASSLPPGDI